MLGETSELGIRLSRNIHHILREEAKLHRVVDPAGGSYYVETLTNELTEKAWALFLEIEDAGGLYKAMKNGLVQSMLDQCRQRKKTDFNMRKIKLVGTNLFADVNEKWAKSGGQNSVEDKRKLRHMDFESMIKHVHNGADLNFFKEDVKAAALMEKPSPFFRLSEDIEKIRAYVSQASENNRELFKLILVGLGNYIEYKPIADFTADYLAPAGIKTEIMENGHFLENGHPTILDHPICICGTDEQFENRFPAISSFIKQNPQQIVMIAGLKKNELRKRFEDVGVKLYISEDMDQVRFSEQLVMMMGGKLNETEF